MYKLYVLLCLIVCCSIRHDSTIVIGEATAIVVIVGVRNVKENAYNARLIATFPHELTFAAVVQLQVSMLYDMSS